MLDSTNNSNSEINLASGAPTSPITFADALENYRKNTDWWIIFDSLDLPSSMGSALWISGRTGISVESVTEALEGLVVLGLLRKSPNGYEKAKINFDLPSDNQTKQQRMEDHALISRQILNHLNEDARGAIRFASFASNIQIIADLYQKIDKALLEAQELSRKLPREQLNNVYLAFYTSITALPLDTKRKGATNA